MDYLHIDRLYTMEYSQVKRVEHGTLYYDDRLPDKWFHNFLDVGDSYHIDKLKDYNVIMCNRLIGDISNYDRIDITHMIAPISILDNINGNEVVVKEVNEDIKDDFYTVMYLENKRFGEEYAHRCAKRYTEVIVESNSKIKYYMAYKDDMPIGYISAYLYEDVLKLEDFCISQINRGKGYGKYLFKYAASKYNANYLYLITEDTMEMYKRWGFKEIGKSYLLKSMI